MASLTLVRAPATCLDLAAVLLPIQEASGVLADPGPSCLLGQRRRRAAPHAGLAVEDEFRILGGPWESVPVLKVVLGNVEALRRRRNGDVHGRGDAARLLKLAWFAGVCVKGQTGVSVGMLEKGGFQRE
ncbi:hypothetical protein ColKHC_02763 [Colletotrichum higginsianum]|nr:hypothetical protein ColKHC_02763 [Colletotrichum higginsianum]